MRAATLISAVALAGLLAIGIYHLTTPTPLLISTGMSLAAAAPLAFIIGHLLVPSPGERSHPVLVSVLSGFGCAMALIGVHRYGERFQGLLVCALAALCIWMLWQRYVWRRASG